MKYKLTKEQSKFRTLNIKLSKENFNKEELEMIKKIKLAGYTILFCKNNTGAEIFEPFISVINKRIIWQSVGYATELRKWNSKNYPLKNWFEYFVK